MAKREKKGPAGSRSGAPRRRRHPTVKPSEETPGSMEEREDYEPHEEKNQEPTWEQ